MRRRLFHRRTSAAFSSLDGLLEFVDLVGGFPSEVGILATEMAVGRGLGVDRTLQVKLVDDGGGTQVEHLAHRLLDLLAGHTDLGVREVVENEFADEVPEKKREAFIRKLLPPVGNVFSAYDLSDDNFALSPEYDLLYTELTGAVVLYIGEYGV